VHGSKQQGNELQLLQVVVMTSNVPSNFPQQPVSGYVQQAEQLDQVNRIEDGVRSATEAQEVRDRIAREIGRTAVNGWSGQG